MMRAIERHDRGEARVIPIIARPVYWQGAPFARLQALPSGAKPVISSSWHSLDEALLDVVKGIGEAIKSLQNIPMGKPPRIALNDYYPGLDYLFDMAISRVTSDQSDAVLQALQAQIEKLASQVSGVGEGDLRVQAEVTADALGVLADSVNYLIEELASLIIRVQLVTTFGMESTNGTLEAIQARKKEIETINKTVVENNTTLSENACALIADQAKQLDGYLVFTESEPKRIGSLMDQLYASVSNFRLPQRVYGVATHRSQYMREVVRVMGIEVVV
jgi:methyl-accepting chemotaxis protein